MAEKHFSLILICLTYLGLSVAACSPHKDYSTKCQSCSKGHSKKLSYPQPNQFNGNAANNARYSTKIHYPSAKDTGPSRVPIFTSNAYNSPLTYYPNPETMSASLNVHSEPRRYYRSVRSMGTNQLYSKGSDDPTEYLPHGLNLRDDVIKRRVRRNGHGNIVSSTTHQPMDSDMTPSWQDLIHSFKSEKNPDVLEEHTEDRISNRANRENDNPDDSHEASSESDDSSGYRTDFIHRLAHRMPHLLQRLKLLQRFLLESSSDEDVSDTDASDPFNADTYTDFDHHSYETEMMDQLETPEGRKASTRGLKAVVTTEELTKESMENDNVKASSTVTTSASQNHEITAPNS